MLSTNVFRQGLVHITGEGLGELQQLGEPFNYLIPDGTVCQPLYFRGGNASDELVLVVLYRDGEPMRWFPIGAKSSVHVALRVVEDVPGGSVVELRASAPEGIEADLVLDLGLVEH